MSRNRCIAIEKGGKVIAVARVAKNASPETMKRVADLVELVRANAPAILAQQDRQRALRLLSSAINYLQRNYWRNRNGQWGWQSDAHAAAFGVLVSASIRIQAEEMKSKLRQKAAKP